MFHVTLKMKDFFLVWFNFVWIIFLPHSENFSYSIFFFFFELNETQEEVNLKNTYNQFKLDVCSYTEEWENSKCLCTLFVLCILCCCLFSIFLSSFIPSLHPLVSQFFVLLFPPLHPFSFPSADTGICKCWNEWTTSF